MFNVEINNTKIGEYLSNLIDQQYESRRAFCRAYIAANGKDPCNETALSNMANRLSQIVNGNKSLQLYDLPYFTELLGVSCEQIISAGEYCGPIHNRVTNYSIASSKNPSEWEAYINHKDKLILNYDEYNKTVINYALEFGNYEFLKFLMDSDYIWFDSRKDKDYIETFGAGTSIEPRHFSGIDYGLKNKLRTEDELRIKLISLAADNNDLAMLNNLRARENPQLYYLAHYLSGQHPDFDSCYNERMVMHIASSSENVLDYFTDSFEIRDNVRYKDGSNRVHTFMFPYISKLLNLLVANNSSFTETALKKALKHNKETYNKLCKLVLSIKNDEQYAKDYMKEMWIKRCEEDYDFYENGDIVIFRAFYSTIITKNHVDEIITNVAQVTKTPSSPTLKYLAKELNESYNAIRNFREHIKEI